MQLPALTARRCAIVFNDPTARAGHNAPLGKLIDTTDGGWNYAALATPFAHRVTGGTAYIDGGANIVA